MLEVSSKKQGTTQRDHRITEQGVGGREFTSLLAHLTVNNSSMTHLQYFIGCDIVRGGTLIPAQGDS
jgi:hypothetical protein